MKRGAAKKKKPQAEVMPAPRPTPLLHARRVRGLLLRGHGNSVVRRLLLNDDLPAPTEEELDVMRLESSPPKGFKMNAPDARSKTFLEGLGLAAFFPETEDARQALTLLRSPRARELVEASAIVGVPLEPVKGILAVHLNMKVTLSAIALFFSVFFDTAQVSRAQLRVAVERRVRQAVERIAGDDARAVRRAVASDARMCALAVGRSEAGWGSVLLAAGLPPTKVDLAKAIRGLESLSVTRAAEAMLRNDRHDPQRVIAYTTALRQLRQVAESITDPNAVLQQEFLKFRFKLDDTEIPTVHDLRAQGDEVSEGPTEAPPAEHYGDDEDVAMDDEGGEAEEGAMT